jgi:hypothetical protein
MNYNHNVCVWQPAALARIYALAAAHLVSARGYPCEVLGLQFDPSFPVRGVSLDTHRGILMKLTFLHAVTPSASPAVAARVAEEERGAPSQIVFQRGAAAPPPPPLRRARLTPHGMPQARRTSAGAA